MARKTKSVSLVRQGTRRALGIIETAGRSTIDALTSKQAEEQTHNPRQPKSGSPFSGSTVAHLQRDLLRFCDRFISRLPDSPKSRDLKANKLKLASAVLDIAMGSDTAANLLDMVTLMELSVTRNTPFRNMKELSAPLEESRKDIWRVAKNYVSPSGCKQLTEVISRWDKEHPNEVKVENVRLSEVSDALDEARAAGADGGKSRHLLAELHDALQTADASVLLGERSLYFAQRLPVIVRAHTDLLVRTEGERLVEGSKKGVALLGLSTMLYLAIKLTYRYLTVRIEQIDRQETSIGPPTLRKVA